MKSIDGITKADALHVAAEDLRARLLHVKQLNSDIVSDAANIATKHAEIIAEVKKSGYGNKNTREKLNKDDVDEAVASVAETQTAASAIQVFIAGLGEL